MSSALLCLLLVVAAPPPAFAANAIQTMTPSVAAATWTTTTTIGFAWQPYSAFEAEGYSYVLRRDFPSTPDQVVDSPVDGRATIAAGDAHSVGVKGDGTVIGAGDHSAFSEAWTDIRSVSAGGGHTLGIHTNGAPEAAGYNTWGECMIYGHGATCPACGLAVSSYDVICGWCGMPIPPDPWPAVKAVAAGGGHSLGLTPAGTVVSVGSDSAGQCGVGGWTDITAIAASLVAFMSDGGHSVGLRSDGTVVAVGDGSWGECDVDVNDNPAWSDIVAVAAGADHTVGLKADGTVVAAGGLNSPTACNVSSWQNITAVAAGDGFTLGLRAYGGVFSTASWIDVSSWSGITAIAAGADHALGLKANGTVVAAGFNPDGRCDVGSWSGIRQPWHDVRRVTLPVEPGTYYFSIRGRDRNGAWSDTQSYGPFLIGSGGGGGPASKQFVSVEGATRIETAVKASQAAFGSAETVIVATAYNFPDALGGSSLAGVLGAPLLLTTRDSLPQAVLDEITRLHATKAIILGSDKVVGPGVANQLTSRFGAGSVSRIGGVDRYETAALVANATLGALASKGRTFDKTVYVATGENFPDALAVSPVAAAKGRPILLTRAIGLPPVSASALTALGATKAIILGSNRAVSDGVAGAIGSRVGAGNVSRLQGETRYQTAIAIAEHGVGQGLAWDGVALATGSNYPDALSGGVMQGRLCSVMLLTEPTVLTPDVRAKLVTKKAQILTVRFLGSTKAVSQGVRDAVTAALR